MLEVLFGLLAITLLLTSLRVWLEVAERLRHGQTVLQQEPYHRPRWTLVDLLAVVAIYLTLHSLGFRALGYLWEVELPESLPLVLAANALANVLAALAAAGLLRRWVGVPWGEMGLGGPPTARDLKIGLAAFAAVSVPVYALQLLLTQWIESEHPLVEYFRRDPTAGRLAVCGLAAVVVAPATEEFFFRVLLQGWMERWWRRRRPEAARSDESEAGQGQEQEVATSGQEGKAAAAQPSDDEAAAEGGDVAPGGNVPARWGPIVGSSLVFAAMHYGHGPDPIPLFLLALALGYLYQRTRRIWPPLVVHVALNGLSLVILWVSARSEGL